MSYSAQNWAWEQTCRNGIAKTVLNYLANCADNNGECFPSIHTICRVVQHGECAVRKAIRSLVEDRLLEREERTSFRGQTSNQYRLPVTAAPLAKEQSGGVRNSKGRGLRNRPTPPCESATPPPANPQENPITEPRVSDLFKEDRDIPLPPHRAQAREAGWTDDQRRIVAAWNATGLPPVRQQTRQRQQKLAQRLREHGVDGVLEGIGKMGASQFCRGQNDRGWRANFDFALRDQSLTRAREGYYDNRTNGHGADHLDVAGRF